MKKPIRFMRVRGRIVPIYKEAKSAVKKMTKRTLITSAALVSAGLSAKTAIKMIRENKQDEFE